MVFAVHQNLQEQENSSKAQAACTQFHSIQTLLMHPWSIRASYRHTPQCLDFPPLGTLFLSAKANFAQSTKLSSIAVAI
jgi:hypothetical protein